MKYAGVTGRMAVSWIIGAALFLFITGAGPALAEAEAGNWRPTYDTIMLWVNFAILAFVIVKFGKKPLGDFLHGQRESIAGQIDSLEEAREKSAADLKKTQALIEEGESHIETIKARIVKEGERVQQEIIQEAHKQSEFMLTDARRKVKNQFLEAHKKFRAELVDKAIATASEKITREITEQDQQALLNRYFETLSATEKLGQSARPV